MISESTNSRLIGDYSGRREGPTVFVTGGIHGNEPSGALAAGRVMTRLHERQPEFRGRLIAARGNVAALNSDQRFLSRDLNRVWSSEQLRDLMQREPVADRDEQCEQRALLTLMREAAESGQGPFILLDLHSSSAPGAPFIVIGDTLRNRRLAASIPLPVILGLEEALEGSLIEFVCEHGHAAAAVEGGQEGAEASELLESALWLALVSSGCLRAEDLPDFDARWRSLGAATNGAPRVVEILHRHGIEPADGFRMADGFDNFSPVTRGAEVGSDRSGVVRAESSGLVLLPLRQEKGEDGYFIGRKVGPISRMLTSLFRTIGLQHLLHLLPGVRRDQERAHTFRVDPSIARILVHPLFNLLGYRRRRATGSATLTFTRRRPDHLPVVSFPREH